MDFLDVADRALPDFIFTGEFDTRKPLATISLISGNQHAFAREIDKEGKIVWEYKDGDTSGIQLFGVHEAIRLANGNTVLTNWCPGRLGSRKAEWPRTIQLVEVTPDKKVVWVLREWTDPDLGTSSCVQMLDEPGNDEDQELMR